MVKSWQSRGPLEKGKLQNVTHQSVRLTSISRRTTGAHTRICPEGARTIQPGASEAAQPRSDALGRRSLKPSKPQPGRNKGQRIGCYHQCSRLARFSLREWCSQENEPSPRFVTPRLGLRNCFSAFPGRRDAGVAAAIALPRARLYRPVGPEEWRLPIRRNSISGASLSFRPPMSRNPQVDGASDMSATWQQLRSESSHRHFTCM